VTVRKPRAVLPGDRIAVVAPASPFSRDEFDRGLVELRRLGYEPVYDATVFAREAGYLAGAADLRAAAFLRHWEDPGVAAIVAARGGYGSVQILPLIASRVGAEPSKMFIGYSDNTSVLSWLTSHARVTALHGPMLEGRLARGGEGYDEASFIELLQGRGRGLILEPAGIEALRPGEAAGPLFGGTLTQLTASLGTPYAFDPPDGCVLFLEDVNERPYRLDRMLTQLQLSGILSRARGMVFGEMRGCHEPDVSAVTSARDVIERFARGFNGPVLCGFPSGHTTGPCWTLPLGVAVRVRAGARPSLTVEESPVA
jgi:muramoyltetrapeptide carboxypeptidase